MPYMDIRSSKPIDGPTKNKLQLEIGKIMPIIPGKEVSNTLFCFLDSYTMYKEKEQVDAVFVDVRMYQVSPLEAKREFVKAVTPILADTLNISPGHIHLNFIEQDNWGVGGDFL